MRVGSSVDDVEQMLIFATLEACGGNKQRTAEVLGVSLKTLYNRLTAYRRQASGSSPSGSDPSLMGGAAIAP